MRQAIDHAVGANVLLVLRDQERNVLIPARWASITLAQQIGRTYYFEYLLGGLVAFSHDATGRETQISEYTALLSDYHPALPGPEGAPLEAPSVFRSVVGHQLPQAAATDLTEWGNTTAAVATARIFRRAEFLHVTGLFDLAGVPAPIVDEHFVVRPNTVYQLRVFQGVPVPDTDPLPPHEISVNTFGDHIVQLRPRQRAVGKYDMLTFVLKTRRLPPNERSAIEIPLTPSPDKAHYAPNALYLPVVTRSRSKLAIGAWVVALAAALALMFRPQLIPLDETLLRNLATVVFVLLISGLSGVTAGLWPTLPWTAGRT